MSQPQSKPDALVDPFQPHLHEKPESRILSGEAFATEANRFWAHRWQAYASYFDKLSKCATFADVARLQTTFWTDLQRDYLNEGATLMSAATLTPLPPFARAATPLTQPLSEPKARTR